MDHDRTPPLREPGPADRVAGPGSAADSSGLFLSHLRRGGMALFLATLLGACGGDSDPVASEVDRTIVSVEVSPADASLAELGQTVQLSATALNAENRVVTSIATEFLWSSSDASVVSVDAQGLATAVSEGNATISATIEGRSGSGAISVDLAVSLVEVTPALDTVRVLGTVRRFAAAARTSQGGVVSDDPGDFGWTSSDPEVATVDAQGRVVAVAAGTARITASLEGVAGSATLVIEPVAPGEFLDSRLEDAVREALDRPSGPLSAEDVAQVTTLVADQFGIADLTGLEHLVNLEVLDLFRNQVEDLTPVGRLSRLRTAHFGQNEISDLTPLAGAGALEELNLSGQTLTGGLHVLAEFPALADLRLIQTGIRDLTFLAGAPSLVALQIQANQELTSLAGLEQVPTLNRLFMTNSAVTDLEPLRDHPGLRILLAEGNPLESLGPLATLPELEILHLGSMATTDLTPLAALTRLEGLRLQDVEISDLSALAGLSELESLTIIQTEVADLSALEGLGRLRQLLLPLNRIEDVAPLVANPGLGSGATIQLRENPLSRTALCEQIPALVDRGARVFFDGSC